MPMKVTHQQHTVQPERLYNEFGALKPLGLTVDDSMHEAVAGALKGWLELGIDGRDLISVATSVVQGVVGDVLLKRGLEARKLRRKQNETTNQG